ncbi:putative ribonuclease H-like domain-containing protein [Tanacetum coccineum]
MDQDSVHMVATSKVTMLKPGWSEIGVECTARERGGGDRSVNVGITMAYSVTSFTILLPSRPTHVDAPLALTVLLYLMCVLFESAYTNSHASAATLSSTDVFNPRGFHVIAIQNTSVAIRTLVQIQPTRLLKAIHGAPNYLSGLGRRASGSEEEDVPQAKEHVLILSDFEKIDEGYVAFGGNPNGGKITDDYSRFSWVFFLATKDETSGILKSFITGVENLIDQRVKVIRCDNRTEFKNKEMNQFCERKGIKREFSVARTPQQNGVAERKNRTLIEAARTMLADSKLPTTFWAKAVNTACYVQNRVLVTKPHNKTPYELFLGRKPALGFMKPFGCPVTILNTIDHLGKFNGKVDEGLFVRKWTKLAFDIDALTKSTNYKPIIIGNQSNGNAGTKACDDGGAGPSKEDESNDQEKNDNVNNTNNVNTASDGNNTNNVNAVSSTVNAAGIEVNIIGTKTSIELPDDPNMPALEDIVYSDDDEDVGAEANMDNLDAFMPVSPFPTTRVHKDHPVQQIIRDLNSAPQTRRTIKNLEENGLFSSI